MAWSFNGLALLGALHISPNVSWDRLQPPYADKKMDGLMFSQDTV